MMTTRRPILLLCLVAALATFDTLASADLQLPKCSKLLVRKEWRKLRRSEKAEWVGAVKVRPRLFLSINIHGAYYF